MLAFLVAAVAILVYSPSLPGTFQFDDEPTILQNPSLSEGGHLLGYFTDGKHFSGIAGNEMYRPVLLVTYRLNYLLGGYSPFVWHLTNVLLHGLNAALVLLLAFRILALLGGRSPGGAAPLLAGLVFALHPVHSEVVNYVSARSGALATAGFLGAFLLYLAATRGGRRLAWPAAVVLHLAGLGGKEIAITLVPAVVLLELLDPANGRALRRVGRAVVRGLPFLLVSVAYLWWRKVVLSEDLTHLASRVAAVPGKADLYTGGGRSILENLMTQARVFWIYARLLLFPVNLAVDRFVRVSTSFTEPMVMVSTGGIALVAVLLLRQWRKRPAVTFAGGVGILALLPTSSLIPLNVLMNEHRLYLPGVGIAILAGFLLAPLLAGGHRRLVRGGLAAAGICFSVLVVLRCLEWQDPETLWRQNVKASPKSYRGHNQVGSNLYRRAARLGAVPEVLPLLEEAMRSYETAARLYPEWPDPHFNMGLVWREKARITGREEFFKKSIAEFEEARRLARAPWRATVQLATTYGFWGKRKKAIEIFAALAEKDRREDGTRKAYYLRPMARLSLEDGRPEDAVRLFREILEHDPDDADAVGGLASALAAAGRPAEAEEAVLDLLRRRPRDAASHLVAARYYRRESVPPRPRKAALHFRRAMNLGHRPTPGELREYR